MTAHEVWKPVPGWAGLYEVSSAGQVRSLGRHVPATKGGSAFRPGRLLSQATKANGYKQVTLTDGTRRYSGMVHSLVLLAFSGPPPENAQVRHLDGDKSNNRAPNLAYGTAKENAQDRDRHGTTVRGPKWHSAHRFDPRLRRQAHP